MPNSPLYREGHNKSATCTVHDYSSTGDGSSLFNCHEVSYTNGNSNITSDLITRNIVQTDNVSSNRANNISNTAGNDSVYTYELNEGAYGSRMRIVGNADAVYRKSRQAADIIKSELVAARSGFNDDRNSSNFNSAGNSGIPNSILNSISSIPEDVADGDDEPLSSNGTNLLISMASDVSTEISNYSSKFSKISSSSQQKKAELSAKNESEKQQKQQEVIENMPDSPSKERMKNALATGDTSVLSANPSNENKKKTSIYNRDDYESKVAEVLPELIEIERHC